MLLVDVTNDDNPFAFIFINPSCDAKVLFVAATNEDNPLEFSFIKPSCDVRVE